ncbi:CRB-like protein [Mya arenaria]|uniref:CRB-like protein n=1 Tax=Mya arenaria TaxID=6604 RepID=A0ABY7FFK2_MYAAR|nr:CRB-like protein [Mya arenaria]
MNLNAIFYVVTLLTSYCGLTSAVYFEDGFYFTVGQSGLVRFVHYHPEELYELLSLKKVLASTLTTHVQVGDGPSWQYDSEEEDHAGTLNHRYEGTRLTDGVKLVRSHQSLTDVHRLHHKTVHMDTRLTPQHVELLDNITLQHAPSRVTTRTLEGAAEVEEDMSGEFPKISSISRSRVKLMAKSKHYAPPTLYAVHEMHQDSISVKQRPQVKIPLREAEKDIQGYLQCIHAIENKYDRNRTECVHQLRTLVHSLERDDFLGLGQDALSKECPENDTLCADERNLFIDLIAREGSADAQLLVLELVMMKPNATEDDLRRCLFHSIAIQSPVQELVQYVEALCFEDEHIMPGDTPTLTKTRKRACLSLGAMAKSLHDRNLTESDRIVERIEHWLDHHNESRSMEIVKPRRKRSIIQHDIPARKHIETKTILIQSLGNAGKTRSLRHIRSYMEPNGGVTAWRRAAIHSLRHFTCNEEPEIISNNYTYPIVSRARRSLLQTLEQGIQVTIKPPGFEWSKTLGTSNIGASFGLIIRNILDLKLCYDLNVLKDFGINSLSDLVHIFDKIVAKIVDPIVDAVTSFKKVITMLKDGKSLKTVVNTLVDTVKHLPTTLGDVVNRMKDFIKDVFSIQVSGDAVVDEIKAIVKEVRDFVDGTAQDALKFYNDVVDSVTMALPFIAKKITDAFNCIVEAIAKLFTNPMQAITSMSTAVIDIKMAITMVVDVKNKIVDACKFIKGRVTEWISMIKRIPSILNRMKEVFRKLANSIKNSGKAIGKETKSLVSDGVNQVKGGLNDLQKDLEAKWNHVIEPFQPLIHFVSNFVDLFKSIMDAIQGIKWGYKKIKETIETSKSLVQKVFGPKFHRDFPTARRGKFDDCPDGVWPTTANGAYDTTGVDLKLGVGQSIQMPVNGILKIFKDERKVVVQPKDPEFIALEIVIENIDADQSKDGKSVDAGEKIGKATTARSCKPRKLDIIVKEAADQSQDGNQANTDKLLEITIGEAKIPKQSDWLSTKASRGKNYIHVSVRPSQGEEILPDADYDYTDPSPFLDRLVPIPKWIQDCNDHEFRYIGQTFESGESAEGEDPDSKEDPIDRGREPDADALDDMLGDEDTSYRPDDPDLYDPSSFGDSLKESLKEQAKQFAEFFKTALFGKNGPEVPNILEIVDVNGKTVDWIINKLSNTSEIGIKFNGIVHKLACAKRSEPFGAALTMTPNTVLTFLKNNHANFEFGGLDFGSIETGETGTHGHTLKFGDPGQMTLTMASLPEKICPAFKDKIAKGFGHICFVHDDCLGLSCNVPFFYGAKTTTIHASVALKPLDMAIVVEIMDNTHILQPDGTDVNIDLHSKLFGMNLFFVGNVRLNEGTVHLTAEFKLCADLFAVCLPPIELFHDIPFIPNGNRRKRETGGCPDFEMWRLPVPMFMMQLSEFGLMTKEVTQTLEQVRQTVLNELMNDVRAKLADAATEFASKIDFCVSANIPVPPFDIVFFNLRQHFMVGPVPLSLGFGAGGAVGLGVKVGLCVVSMTTQLTLTPWVGGKVWGDAAIDIGFARGGIRLIGYLMETKARMDLILKPLRLELRAFAEIFLIFKRVTVFEGTLWKYSVPTITKNIFDKKKRDDDPSPPDIQPLTINERRRRSGSEGCLVQQIYNRPYYDPAFKLEMYAQDEVSETKLFYAIGTHKGGTDVQDWTDMGGNSLMVPAKIPGGIPIYWSVKAKNSQGLEAIVQCSLNTYDSTITDGRVEHSYMFSSHPSKMVASVVAFDDSPLKEIHYKAVGYSPGKYGSQFVGWEEVRLDHSSPRQGVSGQLQHFTHPREGKLVAYILQTTKVRTPELCALACISYGYNCVSFDYEYHSETCDLHDIVEGANAYLRISGTYSNYERLGIGYHVTLEYDNLPLSHGAQYFVNVQVNNVLGYQAFLLGEGTLVDFTPPEPGPIMNNKTDYLKADRCNASVTQRCNEVTWKANHRTIVDGPGSGTVFNGHEPLKDGLYTLTNHYVAANWKGFHDDESGIWGYTWAVGKNVCSSDVIKFENPYAHLTDKKFWTDSAFHKDIHLPDGPYYVTVQALNGADLGGSLVTTVCHSTPFIVDTTPPVFHKVTDIIYDEDFDLIAIYYNATDELSKIAHAEFGLGKTKYDVQLKPYGLHAPMEREDPFVAVEDLGLQEGVPAWIRIRVTNNVELFTAGHGEEPILIDKSPPIPGNVMDGDRLRKDRQFQADNHNICAQWIDFYDPESGIDRFLWGVGTSPQKDDIVAFHNLTRYDKSSCSPANLQHKHIYYSTVLAYNNALNSKASNSSSDGVLVDTTPPLAGSVADGKRGHPAQKYSSETVSKFANWHGFHDPESGIQNYRVDVFINNEHKQSFETGTEDQFEDHTISMEHRDNVNFKVHGVNGADLEVDADSNGFQVDLTPPIMTEISDNDNGQSYQSDNTYLSLKWNFQDEESGISLYRVTIYESIFGNKQKNWPQTEQYNETKPVSPYNGRIHIVLDNLSLKDGHKYSLHVSALNGAKLSTSHETQGCTIDTTPPDLPNVHIGLPKDDEELDDNGNVVHNDQNGIRVSWSGRDAQSGIETYRVAVGTEASPESILPYTDFGKETIAYINNIFFNPSEGNGTSTTYKVSVMATNGAGLTSLAGESRPIFVHKANVPGIVFDGRNLYEDEAFTIDHTSIAASFYGFESDSCDIIGYDWAIGTTEFGTDVLSYTDFGLVMNNKSHGQCQIHTELFEDVTYYISIRAVLGCHEEYIVSCSDGITLDRIAPAVTFEIDTEARITTINNVIYQSTTDSLGITGNSTDRNGVSLVEWSLGTLPALDDKHPFTGDLSALTSVAALIPGEAVFLTAHAVDKAGNQNVTSSMALIADITSPIIKEFDCTNYISARKSLVTCSWLTVIEEESLISDIKISMGSNSTNFDILDKYVIHRSTYSFTRDLFDHINHMPNMTTVYILATVSNVVGLSKSYGWEVIVDLTPPTVESLDVVTSTIPGVINVDHQQCQLPRGYIEVKLNDLADKETEIDENRYELAIGSSVYGSDYLAYTAVKQSTEGIFFMDGFILPSDVTFYATMRIYNKAGLKTEVSSQSVVVSQTPYLTVKDGDQDEDIDYQSVPNLIQGTWKYTDACPITEAKWSVEDLAGRVLFDFIPIPNAGQVFFNDEVQLENGMKYIVTVHTIDALGRKKVARSDGVSIRIQPPLPGSVRDGLDLDLNYQFSTTELSANWDNFGDGSNDPTQTITRYKVAVGNDRRYSKTRSNVHYFVNVGLNTSFTFTSLNLTSKLVRYYITVRGYSQAGGFIEGYSNGIRVGFDDDIRPGSISVDKYQASTNKMSVSYNGFQSDIAIIDYKVAISSHNEIIANDTVKCVDITKNLSVYDVSNLQSYGLNEYVEIDGLQLLHGGLYYVTVVAEDEAGMCIAVTGDPIQIDTTPPQKGQLLINGIAPTTVVYLRLHSEMHVEWDGFSDSDSGIRSTHVKLYECETCLNTTLTSELCYLIDESFVADDTKTAFYELDLNSGKAYYIGLEVTNGANLKTTSQSSVVLVDEFPPLSGQIKITKDWKGVTTFQHSTSSLSGFVPIAMTEEDYQCPNQLRYFPMHGSDRMTNILDEFSEDFLVINATGAYMGIGYNSDLSKMTRTGILSEKMPLQNGNYTISIGAATGNKIITTVAVITDPVAILYEVSDKPAEVFFDLNAFDNITGLEADNFTDFGNLSAAATSTTPIPGTFKPNNETGQGTADFEAEEYGFGIHILGYKIGNNEYYHHVFWAKSKFKTASRWFQTTTYPDQINEYIVNVRKSSEFQTETVDLLLIVDGDEKVSLSGFSFYGDVNLAAVTWNEDNYMPPLDIYQPFYSDAVLRAIDVPDDRDKLCRHGRAFYDGESGIKELWIGVSDNIKEMGNILPLSLFKKFCFPCIKPCDHLCREPCTDEKLSDGFNLVPIELNGLNMDKVNINSTCDNITSEVSCNSTSYYINAKLVNFAGEETTAVSNAIQIDTTPPKCYYVKCTDPEYNVDQPTEYLGSNSTIGAYWNCTEMESLIVRYKVEVVDITNGNIVMNTTDIGLKTRVRLNLANGTFEDGNDYAVRLTVLNSAGLTLMSTCKVHVNLYPPDVSAVDSEPLYTDGTTPSMNMPYWTDSQTQIVSINSTGSAAIVHGKVHYNSKYINKTVSEYRNMTNKTLEQIQNLTSASEQEKSFFNMEPGRCYYQSLYARGYSHLTSKIKERNVCVKRSGDAYLDGTNGKSVIRAYKMKSSSAWVTSDPTVTPDIIVDAQISGGGLTVGTITQSDQEDVYGSAATMDYKPYISNIQTTLEQTSRLLRNRIQRLCNVTFFLTPSPVVEVTDIAINMTLPVGCEKDSTYQPALIYWDKDEEQWVHIDEGCNEYLSAIVHSSRYNSTICGSTRNNSSVRKRRETSFEINSPRQYNLVRIAKTYQNSPPKIVTENVYFTEDITGEFDIETSDAEKDVLSYRIVDKPSNLDCNITSTGKLKCIPEPDFYGEDTITVEVTETGLPSFEDPNSEKKKLRIDIQDVPDKTERFFLDLNETWHDEKRPSMKHTVITNANRSSSLFVGKIILADVDGGEKFTNIPRFTSLGNSTFSLNASDLESIPFENYTTKHFRSKAAYDVDFEFSPLLQGKMVLDFIAQTEDSSYTPGVTITVFVLENPCIHGYCNHPTLGEEACNDTARSDSFVGYECVCYPGYKGEWCQTEIDECAHEPCSTLYDCEDLVNDYECNINIPKLMAVIICPLLFLILVVYLLRRLMIKIRYMKMSRSRVGLMDEGTQKIYEAGERPRTAASIFLQNTEATDVVANTKWHNNRAFEEMDENTANPLFGPGIAMPPHHRKFNDEDESPDHAIFARAFAQPESKPSKFSADELNESSGERLKSFKPMKEDAPRKRFAVEKLIENEPSGPAIEEMSAVAAKPVKRLPPLKTNGKSPIPKATLKPLSHDAFGEMVEKLKKESTMTDINV